MTSENLKAFLDFVDECQELNTLAKNSISTEEKRQQDLLHEIEFETNTRERNKLSTRLHKCRIERRKYKDIFEETDDIVQFFKEPQHKKTLDQMRQLLGRVRKVEKYHENRIYIPRVKD